MTDTDSPNYNDTNQGDPRETPDERTIREQEAEILMLRQFKKQHDILHERISQISTLLAQDDGEAEKDRVRLDWLENNRLKIFGVWWNQHPLDNTWSITGNPTDSYSGGIPMGEGPTLRSAINAALPPTPAKTTLAEKIRGVLERKESL